MYYPEWREYQKVMRVQLRAMRAKNRKKTVEQVREIAETQKSTAIFYSRKFHNANHNSVSVRELAVRVGEIVAAGVAFGIIICGLNMFALIF